MGTIKFKSNLKCNGCVNAIKPGIESIKEIKSRRVFFDVENKTLKVDFENISDNEICKKVIHIVTNSGYTIEKL